MSLQKMNKTRARKYLNAIKNTRGKNLSSEALARHMGIYPDVIRKELSFFEPMITMDMEFNFRDLVSLIEQYIENEELNNPKKERVVIRKSELNQYNSVSDFLYQKLTIGGLVDKNKQLSELDLKTLKKLVNDELVKLEKKNKKSKHK